MPMRLVLPISTWMTLLGFAKSAPLSVDISGSADLRYSGAPSMVQLDISGGADLTILD